jgi:hypothetical protein
MKQDYKTLSLDELELLEKETLRVVIQALQDYSREAREIFENTKAPSHTEIIVLAEDLVQYALEVAELFPINQRFAGFIDYKRVRWMPTSFGIFPQVLLVDAKASTENNRETLQQSQLPLDATFISNDVPVSLAAGVPPHMDVRTQDGRGILAVTTSLFVHFYYEDHKRTTLPYRSLKAIYTLAIPHSLLKQRYNPDANTTFFGQGKHSPRRSEAPRIRVYFSRLRRMCPWRLQELLYVEGHEFTAPKWRDVDAAGAETSSEFQFIGR